MSWLQKLFETYPHIENLGENAPWPEAHIRKNAHVEVVVDIHGKFQRAKILEGDDSSTLIPVTEKSASRTGNIDPHPLCEEMSYCAFDLVNDVKKKNARNNNYLGLLSSWCDSPFSHPKIDAIRTYVLSSTLWSDVSRFIEFPIVFKGKSTQKIAPNKCFVRWRVEVVGDLTSGTWEDPSLVESWIKFEKTLEPKIGFCYVTGDEVRLAKFHSKFIRHAADGARFITQNDWDGFTFLGRFTDSKKEVTESFKPSQVSEVAYGVTQKAHNALRWLIANQGKKNGDQVVVAWAVSGKAVPKPLESTYDLDNFDKIIDAGFDVLSTEKDITTDLGQSFSKALSRYMAGYFDGRVADLKDHESIVIMGLDSATPGRMAITYYRRLPGSEFLQRLENWHLSFAWLQNHGVFKGKRREFVGPPTPNEIAEAAYGVSLNEKLKNATRARLLPCIVDGNPFPPDLVRAACQRASNRIGVEWWEWEKTLGIACALYKGTYPERSYDMALDRTRRSRDYLFGRLLAIADNMEKMALDLTKESRETNAARQMAHFARQPMSSWLDLDSQKLPPYRSRLQARAPGFLRKRQDEIQEVCNLFDPDDFNDTPLTGEFLLGFHCQRSALLEKADSAESTDAAAAPENQESE